MSNASDLDASRPVTSDMLSFKATVIPPLYDAWLPPPRPRRCWWWSRQCRKGTDDEDKPRRASPGFKAMKIESTLARRSSDVSTSGYMYSRGSLDSDASWGDATARQRTGRRVRAWQALSKAYESEGDATPLAALVYATPMTVLQTFVQTVGTCADRKAFSGREAGTDVAYTWAHHAKRVQCATSALSHLGFGAGEGVVVCASTSPIVHAIHLAVIAVGGVVAHVHSAWSARELHDEIVPMAHATILVVDTFNDAFRQVVAQSPTQFRALVVLDEATATADVSTKVNVMTGHELVTYGARTTDEASTTPSIESLVSSVRPDQCCVLAFEYDAVGRIRAAELSHDNVLFTAAALVRSFGLGPRDRLVAYLPLHHVAAQVLELYVPLIAGLSVVCAATFPRPLVRVVRDHKPTVFFATPATWAQFRQQVYRAKGDVNAAMYRWAKIRATKHAQKLLFARGHRARHRSVGYRLAKALVLNHLKKKIGLESCTACYSVLAPLDFELERLFQTVDTPIYQLFGTAETCGFAALNFPHASEVGTAGRALPGTTLRCDERSHETVFRGRNVFLGYRKPVVVSTPGTDGGLSPCVADGWLRMRQRAFLTPTGFLRISDPRDFLVLSTGDWVPTQPFERAMLEVMPELERAVLIGDGRTFLSAFFFLKTSAGPGRVGGGNYSGRLLDGAALRVSAAIRSTATTVGEAIRCQHWAVHFDAALETLSQKCCLAGYRVRKWILMAADFSVESGELDPDTGDVCRRAVDRKYHSLLESLYS